MNTEIYKNPAPEPVANNLAEFLPAPKTGTAPDTTQHLSGRPDAYAVRCEDTYIEVVVNPLTDSNPGRIDLSIELLGATFDPQISDNGRDLASSYIHSLAEAGIQATIENTGDWYTIEFNEFTYTTDTELANTYSSVIYYILSLLRIHGNLNQTYSTSIQVSPQPEGETILTNSSWSITVPDTVTSLNSRPSNSNYTEAVQLGDRPVSYWMARHINPKENNDIISATPCASEQEAIQTAIDMAEKYNVGLYTTRRDLRDS